MKKALLNALIVLNLGLIWGNSLLSGEDSGAMSGGLLAALAEVFPFLASEWGHTLLRKAAHFSEFALLGLLCTGRNRLAGKPTDIAQTGLGLAVACIDETIQIFTPGRASSLVDVWIDTAGFAAGMAVCLIGYHIVKHKHNKPNHNHKGVITK